MTIRTKVIPQRTRLEPVTAVARVTAAKLFAGRKRS
jgi:hypothetical protein